MRPADPSRDDVEAVLARPEFQYPKSLTERIGDWIGERLEGLFDRIPGVDVPGGAFTGGIGSLLGWLLLLLAVAAVVAVIVIVVRNWVPRPDRDAAGLSELETEHRREATEWAREAAEHERAGEWKLAMRARYRELVRTLVDRRQVTDLAGLTTRELLADVALSTPEGAEDFESACLLFELPWYAHVPTGAEENREIRRLAASVLAARAEAPLESDPLAAVGVSGSMVQAP